MTYEKKIKDVKKLSAGDQFSLLNGKEYIFISYGKGNIIAKIPGEQGGYEIPVDNFGRLVKENADPEYAAIRKQEEETKKVLKSLGLGDKVLCTDGVIYSFIKLNKTKFAGRSGEDRYDIPISMFKQLVEKAEPSLVLEAKKTKIRAYFGQEVQTSWGPAIV